MNQLEVLKRYFGYDNFREGQELLIHSILGGQDVLGIMPTGAGKSICYQVPALMLPGITIVISPLISLMKDQVRALNEAGVHAAYINSSLSEAQIAKALNNAKLGMYKIIYVAPERLETAMFQDFILDVEISMLTVDEAHCISQWGQDFRPSYLNIVKLIEKLPKRPVVSAFTATATIEVKEDIICVLGLVKAKILLTGFDRENLYFEVNASNKKNNFVLNYLSEHASDSGIIYCATRKNVDMVYELLIGEGILAAKYHAGMSNVERQMNQDEFIYDTKPVMVATNAFGMGIDKSNVRFVIHYNMPQSLENYYQEAGRAGRDGEKADCILLYSPQDVMINQFLLDSKELRADMAPEQAEDVHERDAQRLKQMTYYCVTKDCLREYLLNYFGEKANHSCDNCSNCMAELEELDITLICKDIFQCILESRQRFGINVIVGILRGDRKAKLISYGFDQLKTFGVRREVSESRLKQMINELIYRNYLCTTTDKYAIIKLTLDASRVMQDQELVVMKVSKVPEIEETLSGQKSLANKKKAKTVRTSDVLNGKGLDLLEKLKELRLVIAREEKMPPYIIFSDKTLIEMCIKQPWNKDEMLSVSGVGENKYGKYGTKFEDVIKDFTGNTKQILYFEDPTNTVEEVNTAESSRNQTNKNYQRKEKKIEFQLSTEMASKVVYREECTITELVNQLNEVRDDNMKRLTGVSVTRRLLEENYLEEHMIAGRSILLVLKKGAEFGIVSKTKVSEKGNEYEVLYYKEEAQRSIIENLLGRWSTYGDKGTGTSLL